MPLTLEQRAALARIDVSEDVLNEGTSKPVNDEMMIRTNDVIRQVDHAWNAYRRRQVYAWRLED